ncbi:MAG: prephenate dehydratase [Cyanobacteria bacterium SID2]|nr:prephenate dehydratase [Cyanobacteria bacterium SID2]MBP0004356.1 prephenate dehydratase [Cyanobacteria bacterium SBC]
MTSLSIAHLGPAGTYTEAAALAYAGWLDREAERTFPRYNRFQYQLSPYSSIPQTFRSLERGDAQIAVVPVENSIQGSVTVTLDTLWERETLHVQQALVMPIHHALISQADSLDRLETVYSHPQALAQCQEWLERYLPQAKLRSTDSTAEALQYLGDNPALGAIASERAAQLYDLPILAHPINDRPENCTRFWVVRPPQLTVEFPVAPGAKYVSIAFSLPKNAPGALLNPLQVLAERGINMSRIESRPTKRSLGEYLFFIDFEASEIDRDWQDTLVELKSHTEVLKVFGSYTVLRCEELTSLKTNKNL